MRITKLESKILSAALSEYKYSIAGMYSNKEKMKLVITTLTKLEEKLSQNAYDGRSGRFPDSDLTDFVNKYLKCS